MQSIPTQPRKRAHCKGLSRRRSRNSPHVSNVSYACGSALAARPITPLKRWARCSVFVGGNAYVQRLFKE